MESTAELTPSLDKLYQTFPNCEKDLIPVPKPNDEATQNILSHHKTFKELSKGKQTGFFFPDLRKLLSRTPESQEENPDSNSKPKSHGCIYVPMPLSGNAFLYKNISSVKQNTQQLIVDSLEDQLKFLDEHLDASICLNLLLIFKNKNSENLFDEVKSALQNTCSYQHLRLEFTYCIENEQKRLRRENQPLEGLTKFLMKILATEESSDQSIEYTLSGKMFKHLGGDSFTLREHDKVLNLFKIYFNNFETKLEIVPDCDRILDSLLYSTDKDAQLKHNSSKYLGEVKWFLESLVPELKSATGILLKDWGKNSFNNLLSPSSLYNVDFQLDYLFCTKSNLIAFEVGMTQNFSLPKSALRNKLGQSIAKILPTMKFVAATLLQQAPNSWFNSSGETSDKQKTIETFIKKNVKVVVYIPNASIQGFEEAFNELKHQLNTCPESLSQIFFLLHEHENDSKNIVMRRVNSDLEICQVDYPQQVFEISDDASHQAVGISRDSLPAVEYLFALIVFGNLILNDRREISSLDTAALGVDDRYQLAQDAFLKNQEDPSGQQPYFLNLILSPQQHSILSENKTRVWLRGEPGSGKTALLLAKAIQEAKKEEIDVVIFAVPESTTLLYDFVEKELKRLKTEATADWWKKIDLLRFKRVWEPIRYKHLRKHAPRSSALERDHFQTLKPMLNGMDDPAICKSLKAMKDLLNDTTLEKAKDLLGLNHCNKACSQMVQMFFQTFFLFELCQSGTTDELRSILELLEEKNELQTCLNVKSPQTLLTAVCSSNLDSQVQVEHARVLFDKGFPKKLLLHRLNKSNKIRYTALEWAIKRVNPQLVDLILCDEERKCLFLAEERRTKYLTDLASKSKRNAEVESSNPESTEASNALDIFNQLKRITGNDL